MSGAFDTVLVANRGEIACRILRTARRMGLRTVAVYSDADRDALHPSLADEARRLGPAPARESYLSVEAVLRAARESGAGAVHPGYGFLSENADFAEACAAAGLVFVGPSPGAIRAMGGKSAAKALMERAGVPLVPGYHGEDGSPERLRAEASRLGYPVLIKASAGGGGKGMRVADSAEALDDALALARGEARAAFGDDRLLLERYLPRARHVEVQVFADDHGSVVHLFERDCSVQRRHQKVVEEAPAPGMDPALREAMGRAACEAARAVGYRGAGTVEFLLAEDGAFHFMEMNTRLQVEHPVTEMITGLDLVEWQFRVARGEPLPLRQEDLAISGHAVEVRVYAEDPARDHAPSTGVLRHLRLPRGEGVRVDAGVRAGDAVSVHYDPMIAKVIAHGPDRAAALARLARALEETEAAGPATNLSLLRRIVAHPAFRSGAVDTGFLPRHAGELVAPPGPAPRAVLAAAVARLLLDRAAAPPADPADPHSPWDAADAWRLNGEGYQDIRLRDGEAEHAVRAGPRPGGGFRLDLPDGPAEVEAREEDGRLRLRLDGALLSLVALREGEAVTVLLRGEPWRIGVLDPLAPPGEAGTGSGRVLAPMPGRVLEVFVSEGEAVSRGQALLVLEAMKVQLRLPSPAEGRVEALRCAPGDLVEEGTELVVLG